MNRKAIESVLLSAVRNVYRTYPSCEWEDLVAQAWLIVTEEIGKYDKNKGANLKTYIYNTLCYSLSDYVRRVLLKELNMNGRRVHTDVYDASVPDCTKQMEAKSTIEEMLKNASGVSRDILLCMYENGFNQKETADHLGISKQRVGKLIKDMREGVDYV